MLNRILDIAANAVELFLWFVIVAIAGFAITLICSTAQAQQVRLDLFPQAEPVRLELFPAAEPVRLEMFAPSAPAPKRQRSKEVVPAPIDGPAAELPVVYVYGLPNCGKDRPILAEYAASRGLPFVMKSRPAPEWVVFCPTVHYPAAVPSGWKKMEGNWPGMREFVRIFEAAQVKQQPIRRAEVISTRELIRRMPANHGVWNHPFDLVRHIREHGFTGSLDGLTWHELELLHDGLHEGQIPLNPQPAVIQSPVREQSYRRTKVSRQMARSNGKQFDPFLVISIVGLLFNIFGNCNH